MPTPSSSEPRAPASRARQLFLIGVGWTVIGLGIVIAPLPGPMGLPIAAVGATILMRNSADARRLFVRLKRRAPQRLSPVVQRYDRWREERRRRRLQG
jgi:hypothetical protein